MMRKRFGFVSAVVAYGLLGSAAVSGQPNHETSPPQSRGEGQSYGEGVSAPSRKWRPHAITDPSRLHETSGIVASRKYPGVLWTHGDSGNDPKLIAINTDGVVLAEVMVRGAPNTDWEDICADNQGNLYIGDIGNNHAMFLARYVYRIPEPDPYHPPPDAVSTSKRWQYRYPDKERFDCEAMFWDGQSLYVISNLTPTQAAVYRLIEVSDGQMRLERVAEPRLPFPNGADVSVDGKHLVVSSYAALSIFDLQMDDASSISLSNKRTIRYPLEEGSIESVCFFGTDVIAMTEGGKLYRLKSQDFDEQVRFTRP
jgi:sugar lactone lactonase YvrE